MKHPKAFYEATSEVQEAINDGKPLVALESTIISHGMPYPQNAHAAKDVEGAVRLTGAIPATVAIIEGRVKIGLSQGELEFLAREKNIIKASRGDIPVVMTKKLNASTTVSATMVFAEMAGIRVFATGGIGGVHRGGERNFDISADLQELAHTNVAVVCAGAKAILDLALTLEYLETHGVPVLGYKTDDFPGFYSRESGHKVNYRVDSFEEIAKIVNTKWLMKLRGGVVICAPIPPKHALPREVIEEKIEKALQEAHLKNMKGKELTPFLLSKISELSDGQSLKANIALIKNNAEIAGRIATAMVSKESKVYQNNPSH